MLSRVLPALVSVSEFYFFGPIVPLKIFTFWPLVLCVTHLARSVIQYAPSLTHCALNMAHLAPSIPYLAPTIKGIM